MATLQNTDIVIERPKFNLKTNKFFKQKLIIGLWNAYFIDVTYFTLFFETFWGDRCRQFCSHNLCYIYIGFHYEIHATIAFV